MAYTVYKSYRNKFLHRQDAAYQSKLPMKRWGQIDQGSQTKIVANVYLYLFTKYPAPKKLLF